jgi:tetratricopeptide (TPR) repeat protein
MIKKVMILLLTTVLVGEGVYLASLLSKLRQLESTKAAQVSSSTSQSTFPSAISAKKDLPTTAKGIREEIIKRLSELHKSPIEEVIAECEKKLETNPKDTKTHVKLAEIYVYFPEKHQEALTHLKQALTIEPEHPKKDYLEFWAAALQQKQVGSTTVQTQPSQEQTTQPSSILSQPKTMPASGPMLNLQGPIARPGASVQELIDAAKGGKGTGVIIIKESPKKPPSSPVEPGQIPMEVPPKPGKPPRED